MYGLFTYIYHKHQPNVAKYTIHGSFGSMHSIISTYTDRNQILSIHQKVRLWEVSLTCRPLYRGPKWRYETPKNKLYGYGLCT